MIDPKTGELTFDRGSLDGGLTRSAFLAAPLSAGASLAVENPPYRTYHLAQPLFLDGRAVAAGISFVDERISTVDICLMDPRYGTSWEDWSEKTQLALKAAHDQWLRAAFGRPGPEWRFDGGLASSLYDPRGGGSSIVVRYQRT